MDPHHQHLFVVGTVEDADVAAFGQLAIGPPQEVVAEFVLGWRLEAEDLAAFRVDARHHVLDGAVFAGRIHGLQDQQQGVGVRGIQQVLVLRPGAARLSSAWIEHERATHSRP